MCDRYREAIACLVQIFKADQPHYGMTRADALDWLESGKLLPDPSLVRIAFLPDVQPPELRRAAHRLVQWATGQVMQETAFAVSQNALNEARTSWCESDPAGKAEATDAAFRAWLAFRKAREAVRQDA